MNPRVIDAVDVAPQPWANGGGHTRELLTWPQAGPWRLRISLADVERDGPFSAMAGVERSMAVVHGAGVELTLGARVSQHTRSDPPLVFDGALAPVCTRLWAPA